MMSRLFQQKRPLSKAEKRRFVPFVNQRNFMGTLLPLTEKVDEERANELMNTKNMALIENLHKSTREYFFDKKYQKMARRLRNMEDSLHHKEPDYDQQVARCFETLNFAKTFSPTQSHEDQRYFVDLKQGLNERMISIKSVLSAKIKSHRHHHSTPKKKLEAQFEQQELRATAKGEASPKNEGPIIKREVFKQVGKQSQYMADFSNCGLKYRHFVQSKQINPWKKWYVRENIQIFPGETVTLKKLQKTIY